MSSTCDIPGPLEPLMEQYSKLFPNFDRSLLQVFKGNQDLWFLSTLAEVDRSRILRSMKERPDVSYQQIMFDEIKSFKEGLENKQNRCERIKTLVRQKIIEIENDQANQYT